MSVVVGFTPSPQGRAALAAALRESTSRPRPLIVISHAHVDLRRGRVVADEAEVRAELRELRRETHPDEEEHGPHELDLRVLVSHDEDVAEVLLDAIEESKADLLVIGLRRKSPNGKLNLGASARRLVLSAPCAVLAVKDR